MSIRMLYCLIIGVYTLLSWGCNGDQEDPVEETPLIVKDDMAVAVEEGVEAEEGIAIWPVTSELLDEVVGLDEEEIKEKFGAHWEESFFLDEFRLSYYSSYEQSQSSKTGDIVGFSLFFNKEKKVIRWTGEYQGGVYKNGKDVRQKD